MYSYSEYIPLNLNNVLQRVSEEDIYEMAIGYKPVEYVRVTSPLRKGDADPGCFFTYYNNKLRFMDFADEVKHRDCINMVQDIYKVSFFNALKIINEHFKLGLGKDSNIQPTPPIILESKRTISTEKESYPITFKPRDFDNRDADYWAQYDITRNQLIEDGVFPIIWYKIYSRKLKDFVVIRKDTIAYAYTEFDEGKKKIYSPLLPGVGKWITDCDENDIGNYKNLPQYGDTLIISKSYKDCRVLRNQGLHSVWFQNEGMKPGKEKLAELARRFNRIIVWFDNDETGLISANKLSDYLNSLYSDKSLVIHLPVSILEQGIKDPSDLVKYKGVEELTKFLNDNNLINNETFTQEFPF